jgi:hypothetical protein
MISILECDLANRTISLPNPGVFLKRIIYFPELEGKLGGVSSGFGSDMRIRGSEQPATAG